MISKPEPVVLEIQFSLPSGPSYLDINQVCSVMNRKFLRQGMQIPVSSLEVQFNPNPGETSATGHVTIRKLPTTWVFANAWNKSYQAWKRMNETALAESESIRPRFLDFKIYADAEHHSLGYDVNLEPNTFFGYFKGEWESSKMIIPIGTVSPGATADREFIGIGPNYPGLGFSGLDAVSLIEGYAASRGLPEVLDPNAPADAAVVSGFNPTNWIAAAFNEGTDQTQDVLEMMIDENNVAPYPFENGPVHGGGGVAFADTMYPGGQNQLAELQFHDKLLITTSTIGGSDTAIGGVFPCGLIKFDTSIEAGTATLILRLIPGHERGYLQEPMQEMNRQ